MKSGKRAASGGAKRSLVLVVSVLVLVLAAAGGTLAWLVSNDSASNTFTPGNVSCVVEETFENGVKSGVTIKNTGNIDAYIRVAVVANWIDKDGNVYGGATPVAGKDYTLTPKTGENENWFQGSDGYYYCKTAIESGSETPVLIESCAKTTGAEVPEGYDLQVTILADGIQSVPADAVQQAWPAVQVSGGQLTAGTSN